MSQFFFSPRPSERIFTAAPTRRSKSPLAPRVAPAVTLAPTSVADRRSSNRNPQHTAATLVVLNGDNSNATHEIVTRDLSLSGVTFLLRESLAVGQRCKLIVGRQTHFCEVIRTRLLSNGRHEMAISFRKAV